MFIAVRTGLEPATPCVTGMYSNQAELPHQVPFRDCKDRYLFLNTKFLFYVCKDFERQCRQVKNPCRTKKVEVNRMSKLKVDIDQKYSRYASEISAIPSAYDNLNVTKTFCNNRNCVSLIKVGDFDWVLKRYRRPIFINSIIYTFIRPNKAVRAYRYAKRLLEMGIETPYPVAYMATYRFGLFDIGYFISEYSSYRQLYETDSLSETDREKLYRAFAEFTAALHRKRICHPDYNPGNILWNRTPDGEFKFMLVDINRLSFGKRSVGPYIKSLAEEHLPANLLSDYCAIMGYDLKMAESVIMRKRRHNARKMRIKAFLRRRKQE